MAEQSNYTATNLPSDGQTIDAADVNTDLGGLIDEFNKDVGNSKISNSAITPEKILTGTGSSWAWQSWTPTWTGVTVGNGTVTAKYTQIGKTVLWRVSLVFGTTSAVAGTIQITLPVASVTYPTFANVGSGTLWDASAAAINPAITLWNSTTVIEIIPQGASTTYVTNSVATSTAPFTWTTSDYIQATGFYEAA